jgi:hypothetical protein
MQYDLNDLTRMLFYCNSFFKFASSRRGVINVLIYYIERIDVSCIRKYCPNNFISQLYNSYLTVHINLHNPL